MLRAVIIDDERPALDELSYLLKEDSVEVIATFQNTEGALEFILTTKPDVVFLDIEMRGINGIEFGVELQNRTEKTAVIFVTAYPEYALEAFRAYPLDYIVKPVDEERLARTLRHIQETLVHSAGAGGGNLYIQCFGKFEITFGDNKVKLPTKKTRELLAYLICNKGTMIYRDDLIQLVFGSDDSGKDANNLRVSLFRIRNAFREAGVGKDRFLIRDDFSVDIADEVCDIADFQAFLKNNLRITASNIGQAEKIANLLNGELLTEIDSLWVTEKRELVMSQAEELIINMSIFHLSAGFTEQAEAALLRVIFLNPVSEPGYSRLLDLYMRTGSVFKYRFCYERYCEMTEKEFGERPPKIYADFYAKCTGSV